MQTNPITTSADHAAKSLVDGADHVKESFGQSVYEIAEDARHSVVKAINAAARTLQDLKMSGSHTADGAGKYVTNLSTKLDHLSKRLADKDSVEIGEDITGYAKKYQTPLIVGGLALAYMMFRPSWNTKS